MKAVNLVYTKLREVTPEYIRVTAYTRGLNLTDPTNSFKFFRSIRRYFGRI